MGCCKGPVADAESATWRAPSAEQRWCSTHDAAADGCALISLSKSVVASCAMARSPRFLPARVRVFAVVCERRADVQCV